MHLHCKPPRDIVLTIWQYNGIIFNRIWIFLLILLSKTAFTFGWLYYTQHICSSNRIHIFLQTAIYAAQLSAVSEFRKVDFIINNNSFVAMKRFPQTSLQLLKIQPLRVHIFGKIISCGFLFQVSVIVKFRHCRSVEEAVLFELFKERIFKTDAVFCAAKIVKG